MKLGLRTAAIIALATLVASCGIFEKKKKKKKDNPETLFTEEESDPTAEENSGSGATTTESGLSLAEAFMTHVYPVVKENCGGCHIHTDQGTLPFAASAEDLVIPVASRLIGTKLNEARFYLKVSNPDLPHPDRITAQRVLPDLKAALENFFASVTDLTAGIYTESIDIANAKKQLPKVNPTGWLIMEVEGSTIGGTDSGVIPTKFKPVLGVHSNGKAVGSTGVPDHPVSGLGRAYQAIQYAGEGCAESTVRIDQSAHVDGGEGIAKYVVGISVSAKNSAGDYVVVEGERAFGTDLFRTLPYGLTESEITDADYKNFTAPDFSVAPTILKEPVTLVRFSAVPDAGDFTVTVSGETTAAIAFNASNAAIKAAIEALPSIAADEATITGSFGEGFQFEFGSATLGIQQALETSIASNLSRETSNISASTNPQATAYFGNLNSDSYLLLSDTDIASLVNSLRDFRNDVPAYEYDRFLYGVPSWCPDALAAKDADAVAYARDYDEGHVDRLCYWDEEDPTNNASIKADAEAGGIWDKIAADHTEVFNHIEILAGIRATGQQNLTRVVWNANDNNNNTAFTYQINGNHEFLAGFGPASISRGGRADNVNKPGDSTVHPNETSIPLDWFEDSEWVPGFTRFDFHVPENLNFADLDDDQPVPFRQYYRSSGAVRFRIKNLSTGAYVNVNASANNVLDQTCAGLADGEAWSHRGPRTMDDDNGGRRGQLIHLERGQNYSIEFLQVDQDSIIDAFILVADTELNEHLVANPNTEPTVLRQKFYGKSGDGEQRQTYLMQWKLDFGKFTMEMIDAEGYYALENPIFLMNIAHRGKSVSVKGFDFIVNGNISLTDRSFDIDAVRPAGANAAFGQVLIPKDQGFDNDKLGIVFKRLDVTEEPGELPKYVEGPPLDGVECLRPDVFNDLLWPVYRQQKLVDREEYAEWLETAYPGEYDEGDIDNAPSVNLPDFPEVYTCTTCHNADHPFLQLNANDHLESCNKVIARTNLVRPELSFSLRGLRGQFNHPNLFYTMFDPFDGDGNLRKKNLTSGASMIFGTMIGPWGTNTEADVGETNLACTSDALCQTLTEPKRIGFDRDPNFNIPLFDGTNFSFAPITPLDPDERYGNGDFSTELRLPANGTPPESPNYIDDMIAKHAAEHEVVVQKWVENAFKAWVDAENEARDQ